MREKGKLLAKNLLERVSVLGINSQIGNNLIAFSGGVDSSVVAFAVHKVFPQNTLCILGLSASLPLEQLTIARKVARFIDVKLLEVETKEGTSEQYIKNQGLSCYSCKTHLYSALNEVISHAQENRHNYSEIISEKTISSIRKSTTCESSVSSSRKVVLFNGTNKDDLSDSTRVGLIAARDFNVCSPLEEFTKDEVRAVAKEFGLFNHDYAASPCLRSRLAFGVAATTENLKRIEVAERLVRDRLNIEVQQNLRVRHIDEIHASAASARIELDAPVLRALSESERGNELLQEIAQSVCSLGFSSVSFKPFRSGSVAAVAPMQ